MALVQQYRVTKYNPARRNSQGHYLDKDWTSIADTGESPEYLRIEKAYLVSAEEMLREHDIKELRIAGLENYRKFRLAGFRLGEGARFGLDQLEQILRAMLREQFWARLQAPRAFLHVGYDYYMYIGVPAPLGLSRVAAERRGLFVEEMRSPYLAS